MARPRTPTALIAQAQSRLAAEGRVTGRRSARISVRVDPGVLDAAAERLGLDRKDVSALVNASLAVAASPDPFKLWLAGSADRLPEDFEAAI